MKRLLTKTIATLLLSGCLTTGFAQGNEDQERYKNAAEECVLTTMKDDLERDTYNQPAHKRARIYEFTFFRLAMKTCVRGGESSEFSEPEKSLNSCYTKAYEVNQSKPLQKYLSKIPGYNENITELINLHVAFISCLRNIPHN